ncbi:MAG: wax ester/triacylglycerol synthase family O-acyltransferase [Deltaproteobacteria bacterium]|nr:wax ester/triacylglycerol synthase family O-acyltransferase [Deltaproteobacteria bacterium]
MPPAEKPAHKEAQKHTQKQTQKLKLEPMSSIDSFWYSMDEPTNLMVIVGIMEFDEMIDYGALQTFFERRLLRYNRFKQMVVWPTTQLGRPFWDLDPNFDIRNHIIRVALPTPRDKATLQRMISDLSVVPLDKSKPLWQVHIIENYKKGCVLLIRIHHAIADGIALIRLLLSMTDVEPNRSYARAGQVTPEKESKQPTRAAIADPLNLFVRASRSTMSTALKTSGAVYEEIMKTMAYPQHLTKLSRLYGKIGLESATVLTKLALMPADSKTSLKGKLGVQKSMCWSSPITVSSVKELGGYFRCTINDVLMAAISGALRRYLAERGDEVDEVELRVAIPVNVRPESAEVELGNQFSLVLLSLPVNLDDPVRRLRETRKGMRTLKESADAFVGFQVMKVMGIPPKGVTKKGVEFFAGKFTGVLTNVPGPRQHLYLMDKKIKNIMFWVPRSGDVALGISILSYAGSVTLGIATDTHVAPDPQKIIEYFNEEFTVLLDLAKKDVLKRYGKGHHASTQS